MRDVVPPFLNYDEDCDPKVTRDDSLFVVVLKLTGDVCRHQGVIRFLARSALDVDLPQEWIKMILIGV